MPKKLEIMARNLERIIFHGALIFVVLLFVSQSLLTNEEIRLLLSKVDQYEGEEVEIDVPYQDVMARETMGSINDKDYYLILKNETAEKEELTDDRYLNIFINNNPAGTIKSEPLHLSVKPGDLVTIEGKWDKKEPAVVSILGAHEKILHPYQGYRIYTFGEGEIIGWVIIDEG